MFNSSLRRVARTCPNATLPVRPSTTTSPASITAAFSTRSHQRRYSSSKPPIPPNNGSHPIPAASVKQVGAPRSSDKRPGTESRLSKRKVAKADKDKVEVTKQREKEVQDYSNEWTRSLPSVPATQHLNSKDVSIASFFATHRPLSITGPLPPETSIEDIDKIFQVRPKLQRRTQDVIYTISSAVQNLDDQVTQQQQQAQAQHEEAVAHRAEIIKALTQQNNGTATNPGDGNVHHLDGQPQQTVTALRVPGNVKLVIQALARQFRPFNPPPAPTAAPEVEFFESEKQTQAPPSSSAIDTALEESQAVALEKEVESSQQEQQQPTTTQSSSQAAAESTNNFFTPSFHQSSRRTQRGTLLVRHLQLINEMRDIRRIEGHAGIREMLLISVKRQRRLKMKKHKYKKLQRKTRNLRRRQGKV